MRSLYAWPSWVLRAVVRYGVPAGIVADAWVELHARATVDVDRAVERATDDPETGPWAVSPPRGFT